MHCICLLLKKHHMVYGTLEMEDESANIKYEESSGLGPTHSVREAAAEYGVSPTTVWRWVDSGRLPATRIGPKRIRIRASDLAALRGSAAADRGGAASSVGAAIPAGEVDRRRALVARIISRRPGGSLSPLTSADLVRLARDRGDTVASG